jgi:hypothetical protein
MDKVVIFFWFYCHYLICESCTISSIIIYYSNLNKYYSNLNRFNVISKDFSITLILNINFQSFSMYSKCKSKYNLKKSTRQAAIVPA